VLLWQFVVTEFLCGSLRKMTRFDNYQMLRCRWVYLTATAWQTSSYNEYISLLLTHIAVVLISLLLTKTIYQDNDLETAKVHRPTYVWLRGVVHIVWSKNKLYSTLNLAYKNLLSPESYSSSLNLSRVV